MNIGIMIIIMLLPTFFFVDQLINNFFQPQVLIVISNDVTVTTYCFHIICLIANLYFVVFLTTLYQKQEKLTNICCVFCYHFFITKYALGLLVRFIYSCYQLVSLESAFHSFLLKTSFIVVSMSRYYLCKFITAYERGRVCV